jgi:hypothetical protein
VLKNLVSEHLQYFRPGEEARMIARCQFGLSRNGRCGAILTYPIKGFPWRRNPSRTFDFDITSELTNHLFDEVAAMQENSPDHCLRNDVLWSDHSEKANGITRDRQSDTLCHTIAIYDGDWQPTRYCYSMKEDSEVLRSSRLFETVMALIRPHENLETKRAQQVSGGNG